jgi:hypothetical protein
MALSPYDQMLLNDGAYEIWNFMPSATFSTSMVYWSGSLTSSNIFYMSGSASFFSSDTPMIEYTESGSVTSPSFISPLSSFPGRSYSMSICTASWLPTFFSSTRDWTVELWWRHNSYDTPNAELTMLGIQKTTLTEFYLYLVTYLSSTQSFLGCAGPQGTFFTNTINNAQRSDAWNMFCLSHSGTTSLTMSGANFFLHSNGIELSRSLFGAISTSLNPVSRITVGGGLSETDAQFYPLNFLYSKLVLYDRRLSSSIIAKHWAYKHWPSGSLGLYDHVTSNSDEGFMIENNVFATAYNDPEINVIIQDENTVSAVDLADVPRLVGETLTSSLRMIDDPGSFSSVDGPRDSFTNQGLN